VELEEGLYAHLSADATVAALVETRIYPLGAPQDAAMPNLAYQRISGAPGLAHDGPSGLAEARIQITCMAETYAGAKALATAVRNRLHGWRGGWGQVPVGAAMIDSERDDYSQPFKASVVRLDVVVLYQDR
jgi:hypothetical protein